MRIRYAVVLAIALMLPAIAQTQSTKQTKPNPLTDWPMYNRDLAGTRYSPLTQINATNASNLKPAWTYRLSSAPAAGGRGGGRGAGGDPTVNPEATPIVINGVMYL